MLILYSSAALAAGFLLDLLLGDPRRWPHLIRAMGGLIQRLEQRLYPLPHRSFHGALLALITLLTFTACPALLLYLAWQLSPWLYWALETLLCWQLLAVKSLRLESGKVWAALQADDPAQARQALGSIVGRDTAGLDQAGIIRAAVETVAENSSDGVIAPLFYLLLGGAAAGCLYKAANTMDSMIGYEDARYRDFGRFAAQLDDALNFIPARLCALLLLAAAWLCRLDAKNARRVWQRDRRLPASPNAGQSEALVAGALHIRLGGDAYYGGQLKQKPWLGDDDRPVEAADICRAQKLLMVSAVLMLLLSLALRGVLYAAL